MYTDSMQTSDVIIPVAPSPSIFLSLRCVFRILELGKQRGDIGQELLAKVLCKHVQQGLYTPNSKTYPTREEEATRKDDTHTSISLENPLDVYIETLDHMIEVISNELLSPINTSFDVFTTLQCMYVQHIHAWTYTYGHTHTYRGVRRTSPMPPLHMLPTPAMVTKAMTMYSKLETTLVYPFLRHTPSLCRGLVKTVKQCLQRCSHMVHQHIQPTWNTMVQELVQRIHAVYPNDSTSTSLTIKE